MKRLFLFLFLAGMASAQDLQTGVTFSDGDTVNAAALNNAVNNATILPSFLANKGVSTPISTDTFLFYQGGTSSLKQASLAQLFDTSLSFNTRNANNFLAGPGTSGAGAAAPTWRTITPHDTSIVTEVTTGATTINALTSRTAYRILAANTTYTISNMVDGETITVAVRQAAAGGPYTATFTGVLWPSATAPVQTTTANKLDLYTFIKIGGVVYGNRSQNYN